MLQQNEKEKSNNLNFVGRKEDESMNLMGVAVDSEEEAYNLYKDYGHRMGFSVRRGRNRYVSGTNVIRCKDYFCSKEGFKEFEGDINVKQYNKLETRTGCQAMIRFTVEDNIWTVTRFISEHNHELATPSKRHLLRSARSLLTAKANVISSMVSAGIRPTDVYSYISKEACGSENVGFTKRDCYNYLNKQKMMIIEAGDGQSLLNHFKMRANEDPMFFYTIQVDQENRMTNFFWRDGISRIDYDYFGDIVVFDTTYRTNRYNLVCAPFVGINHHRQTIMFACAFLLDETAASFAWLFKSFLQSMGNKSPKIIITDQDHAIGKAIEEVFPDSRHRLCLWHISKNASSHLGSLNTNAEFHALFHRCVQGCESEIEFEETWTKMMNDYKLHDHRWLNGLYKCREKWSTAFSIDIFSSQIKSSQRAEVTNNVLHGISKKEFLDGISLTWREVAQDDTIYTFEVTMEETISRIRTVTFDISTMEINCTCKKFDFCQYLCSHALRILSVKNIKKIPEQFISKRWTKAAKKNVNADKIDEFSQQHTTEADIESVFRNRMVRFAYDFIVKSQTNEKTRELCQKILYEGNLKVEEELPNLCGTKTFELRKDKTEVAKVTTQTRNVRRSLIEELPKNDDEIMKGCANNNSHVSDPPYVRPKGVSNARLKCHLEKRKPTSTSTKQSSSWYSDALNFPHRIAQQNNAANALNLMSQTYNEGRMNEANMLCPHNYGFTPNVQEPYEYSEGHPNPKL
ncbi:hypothetical protein GQ457_16G015180 [Hibiscus cannabinus]